MVDTHDSIPTRKSELPEFDIPGSFATSAEYLHHLVMQGLEKQYPNNTNTAIMQAEHELEIINRLGFTDYFLIVADAVNWAREHDIPVGPGRGTAPASLAVYALGITGIDPLKYGLIFERFANLEHPAIPDIDVDFSADGRERVINYLIEKYGKSRVGLIALYSKYRYSYHSAGVVISKKNLDEYGPVYYDPETGMPVTQHDLDNFTDYYDPETGKHLRIHCTFNLEKHGLTRFDFLGLKTLDTIKQKEIEIRKQGTQFASFSIKDVPLNDKATFRLFSEGNTDGVFQFESEGMQDILQKIKPDCFEHLIAIRALYRPGFMEYIPEYIERRHGHKPIEYLLPCLEDILKETYGIIIYQEQFMQIVQRIAGYTPGQADILRRHLFKASETSKNADDEKKRFITSATTNGFNEKEADILASFFARYIFQKSHAAAWSLLAYQTAYLKANFGNT